jgi:hypothetical protein
MRQANDCSLRLLLFLALTGIAPAALAGVDYAVGPGDLLDGSLPAAGGQVIGVTRTIHNLEGAAPPCPYSYFLNPPTVFLEGNGVPVSILGLTPGTTYVGTTPPLGPYGEPNADNTATDLIVIPDGMPPGIYNLVLVLDPEQQVADADPSNNDTWVAISLSANPLQITSPSSLPVAIIGMPYHYGLNVKGGGTESTWSLLAGAPPNGISLDSQGNLSGTPSEAGVFDIVVQVSSGDDTQAAVLALPVAEGSALSVEQGGPQLPTALANSRYRQQLVAEGGVPPYSWTGVIPPEFSMQLSSAGVLSGKPEEASDGPVQFKVVVIDSIGAQASAILSLQIISPGSLAIVTPFLAPAVVGTSYDQPILASGGPTTGVTFSWSLSSSTPLPAGLAFQQKGTPAEGDLSGTPSQAGIFPLVLNLSDNFGHTATRQYILSVTAAAILVPPQAPPVAWIGEPFFSELADTGLSTLSYSLYSGQLPPGLSLSATGVIRGTVPIGTLVGKYEFSVAVTDAAGGESVLPLEIQVEALPPQPSSSGCATGNGTTGPGLLLLAMVWFKVSRRRNRSAPINVKRG